MIGIDAGTFHTVAVQMQGNRLRIPRRSIPSIALRTAGGIPIVGVDAIAQLPTDLEMILAPKLELAAAGKDRLFLQTIVRKLVSQALEDLGGQRHDVVLTVPPEWTLEYCEVLLGALAPLGISIRFMHEPIAMLLGAMYLAPQYDKDPRLTAKLDGTELVLICDWGAGTVDVALVRIVRYERNHEFSCLKEITEIGQGGTAIARDVVREYRKASDQAVRSSPETDAYMLQAHWERENEGGNFSRYDSLVKKRRILAAETVARRAAEMLDSLEIEERGEILCVLHGGPLESTDLRRVFQEKLEDHTRLTGGQFLHIGNDFAAGLPVDGVPMRRDALVASGAAIFSAGGKALPEFVYEVSLRNAFGELSSSVRLAIGPNLAGIQIVQPPNNMGSDYYVEVQQFRKMPDGRLVPTSIKKELAHYVRPHALVKYSVIDAGVGYACIEAVEVPDTMGPGAFPDAKSAKAFLPERSTRFLIELN